MKQTHRQRYQTLPKPPATALSGHKRRERGDALIELLIHATGESRKQRVQGGNDEPEADQ